MRNDTREGSLWHAGPPLSSSSGMGSNPLNAIELSVNEAAQLTDEGIGRFVPRYLRIAGEIIARIKSGSLNAGDRVPSENEIRAMYQVSNTTARKALAELAKEGWIDQRRGRGSFVGKPFIDRNIARITSFTSNMEQMGLKPSTQVLLQKRCLERGKRLMVGGLEHILNAPYLHIVRLRLGNQIPIMLENRYINLDLCPDLESKDLSRSLFALYEGVYGCLLLKSRQSISAISIGEEAAGKLNCPIGQPGFLVEGALFTAKERLLELESSVYRGDRYHFVIDATR